MLLGASVLGRSTANYTVITGCLRQCGHSVFSAFGARVDPGVFLALVWRFDSLVVLPAQVPLVKVSAPALNVKYPPVFVSWPNSEVYST